MTEQTRRELAVENWTGGGGGWVYFIFKFSF